MALTTTSSRWLVMKMKQASSSSSFVGGGGGVIWLGYFLIALIVASTTTTAWLPKQASLMKQRTCSSGFTIFRSSSSRFLSQMSSSWNDDDDDEDDAVMVTTPDNTRLEDIMTPCSAVVSRRNIFRRSALSLSAIIGVSLCGDSNNNNNSCYGIPAVHAATANNAYTIDKVEPNEQDIYATAQNLPQPPGTTTTTSLPPPLRILWVGPGVMKIRTGVARNGVYKDLFQAGTEVTAFDLRTPKFADRRDAQQYASRQGYTLRFQQGDATKLHTLFDEDSFDVVVSSLFLCQDFDPVVVVKEIQRVLKPGGRFGFYEHVDDIDKVIVDKVFGENSVIKIEAYPDMTNILAGVVQKV
mmetsp:Transcript_53947/g.61302  ORF Transcript_53947/g.61302 Transcript_53947/m.61302 type:complete len:354 (-) Transcript_53947:172-1233(-)